MKKIYPETHSHTGMCDASAAVCIGHRKFVVANDEDNILYLYHAEQSGAPIYQQDISADLRLDPEDEIDIEGATRLDDLIYWISSHGRSRKGKLQTERCRFFTTHIEETDDGFAIEVIDVYEDLIEHLVEDKRLQVLGLNQAVMLGDEKADHLAPKKKGSNIEGLCATADQRGILIGFRNPRLDNKALIVPLTNPEAVVRQKALPLFGAPILLNLNHRGVRSIEYSEYLKAYIIFAGPHHGETHSQLYSWTGNTRDEPKFLLDFENFNP